MSSSPAVQANPLTETEGILLVNKARGSTAFQLVRRLRKILRVKKIGHAGTLDPFATGVMVMLIGRRFTKLSDKFLNDDKEYIGTAHLGVTTDSYDCDGETLEEKDYVPSQEEVEEAFAKFQGYSEQTPPMFSAKKINGQKLYNLARKGIEVERKAVRVYMEGEILSYDYPHLTFRVKCSKGTYIRSLAHDLGQNLQCGAHLSQLQRIRCGDFLLENCVPGDRLEEIGEGLKEHLRKQV